MSGSVPCTDNELPDARVAAVEELPGGGDDVMVQELAPLHQHVRVLAAPYVEYYGFSRTNCSKKTVFKCSKTISSALTTRNACKFVLYAIFLCQPVWPNKLLYIKNTIVVFLLYKNISI